MSCKATRPFISREDAAFLRPDPLQSIATIEFEQLDDLRNDPFKRAGITPDRALEISNLIPRIIKLDVNFLNTVPALKARLSGSEFVNPYEVADLISIAGYDGDELYQELVAQQGQTFSDDLKGFFQQLDFYYDEYLSIAYKPGRCEELYDIWQLIVQVELIVKTAMNWVARLRNFTLDELIAKLANIEKLVKEFLKKLAERIKQRLIQLAAEFLAKIEIFVQNINDILNWITAKVTALEEYLSTSNLEKIAEDIGNEIKKMFSPLADFSISNIAYMIWRLCSLIESIKDFFKNPLNLFKEGLIAFTSARILLDSMSNQKRLAAAERGHIRVDPQTAKTTREQIASDVNAANPQTNGAAARLFGATVLTSAQNFDPAGLDTTSLLTIEGVEPVATPGSVTTVLTDGVVADISSQLPNSITSVPTALALSPRDATGEEAAWLGGLLAQPNYNNEFHYTAGVKTMHTWTLNVYDQARRNPTGTVRAGSRSVPSRDILALMSNTHPVYDGAGWKYPIMQRSANGLSPVLLLRRTILMMRQTFLKPYNFQINSMYRHPIYNKYNCGGSTNGLHTTAQAFDVSITSPSLTWQEQIYFMYFATSMGFTGIGLYGSFIHVDTGAKRHWIAGVSPSAANSRFPVNQTQRQRVVPALQNYFATNTWNLPSVAQPL